MGNSILMKKINSLLNAGFVTVHVKTPQHLVEEFSCAMNLYRNKPANKWNTYKIVFNDKLKTDG
jgi:hypothetical protein